MYEGIKPVIVKVKKPAPLKSKTGELLDGRLKNLTDLLSTTLLWWLVDRCVVRCLWMEKF